MKRLFTTAGAFEVFITVYFPWILYYIIRSTHYSEVLLNHNTLVGISILRALFITGYLALLGRELRKHLPDHYEVTNVFFYLGVALAFSLLVAFNLAESPTPGEFDATSAMLGIVLVAILIYVYSHLAKLLTLAEREYLLPGGPYWSTFFSFMIFVLGVWFLQPRIKDVMAKSEEADMERMKVKQREREGDGNA